MSNFLHRTARTVAYATPLHRWLRLGRLSFDKRYWDEKLQGAFKPYLGGTISVGTRNAIVWTLVGLTAPSARAVIDVGCAAGSLSRSPGAEKYSYVGVDISSVAIEDGRRNSPDRRFHVSRLQEFVPDNPVDVIVFNEVLYYLTVAEAIAELKRYNSFLNPEGILVVSMKHDPKAEAIFAACRDHFQWINGVIYQEKIDGPDYKIRWSSTRPGYLIGVLRIFPANGQS